MIALKSNLAGNMTEHCLDEFLILNVDDTAAALYAKTKILSRAGFQVIEATNGSEALIKARDQKPHLVLLDTRLPDINGFEVCRRLKGDPETSSISILQTSASFLATSDKVNAIDDGADNYLFEPIEPEELIANIKALIRLSLAEHEVKEINRRKDVFLATLAHELRNPLGPIRNSLKLLENLEDSDVVKQHELLNIISRQTNQMVRLVDDLLDVSRISQGKISLQTQTLAVRDFVEAALESSGNVIQDRGHEIKITIDPNELYILGDKVRLVQIIGNLLNNAAKFTSKGGSIELTVNQVSDQVWITVRDNGIGLSAQSLETIFVMFVQHGRVEDKVHEGLGIGLSLVKKLTELHGGTISVSSEGINKGSTFILKFPTVKASSNSNIIETPEPISTNETFKILVVDDNVDAADTLADLLKMFGHDVQVANSGKKALDLANAFEPQVIFLDIGLPDITGYDVAKALRLEELTSKATLIALTGYGTERDQQLAQKAGFDLHLTKPLDYEKIKSLKLGF